VAWVWVIAGLATIVGMMLGGMTLLDWILRQKRGGDRHDR
jgi:hypothetical protein